MTQEQQELAQTAFPYQPHPELLRTQERFARTIEQAKQRVSTAGHISGKQAITDALQLFEESLAFSTMLLGDVVRFTQGALAQQQEMLEAEEFVVSGLPSDVGKGLLAEAKIINAFISRVEGIASEHEELKALVVDIETAKRSIDVIIGVVSESIIPDDDEPDHDGAQQGYEDIVAGG